MDHFSNPDLALLLHLYTRTRGSGDHDLYLGYMEGVEVLRDWLKPQASPSSNSLPRLSWYERNYETQRLSAILSISEEEIVYILREGYYAEKSS